MKKFSLLTVVALATLALGTPAFAEDTTTAITTSSSQSTDQHVITEENQQVTTEEGQQNIKMYLYVSHKSSGSDNSLDEREPELEMTPNTTYNFAPKNIPGYKIDKVYVYWGGSLKNGYPQINPPFL